MTIDVRIQDEGTIVLFRPLREQAREWLIENVQEDAQWFAGALVVEHRYALPLIEGLRQEGYLVG